MQLSPRDKLGPYEVIALIGKGGMGEVYRAHDPRTGRDVAVKVLLDGIHQRFQREVRVVASLNHPNICTLHDVGPNYLVMELVDGSTLSECLRAGPLPVEEAVQIARQIGLALEAAHEKGIIHRDLKPANIKIRLDGSVKVLDFGLAKLEHASEPEAADSATETLDRTEAGAILGTAGYMAPEQASGSPADKRVDIWAFGVVLYEMLTGAQLFHGATVTDTLRQILTKEPDLTPVPRRVRPLIRRCLERDPRRRLRDIGEVQFLLDGEPEGGNGGIGTRWLVALTAAAVLALAAAAVGWWLGSQRAPQPLMRFTDDLGAEIAYYSNSGPALAISPDGTRIVFTSRDSIGQTYLAERRIGSAKYSVLGGTEGGSGPFLSPDSRWVAFFADQKLKKVPIDGGSAITLCDASNPRGGVWGDDDQILFADSSRGPLMRVAAAGGKPQQVTEFDMQRGEATHRWPQVLPGRGAFLFTSSPDNNSYSAATIEAQSEATGKRKTLAQGYAGRYFNGYLLYMHKSIVYAAPMDPIRLELTGPARPILEDVAENSGALPHLATTPTGTLAYVTGASTSKQSLFWLDAGGSLERLPLEPGPWSIPRPSPDGKRIALLGPSGNAVTYDWAANRVTPLTFLKTGISTFQTWTPDGKYLIFPLSSPELAGPGIYAVHTDGVGEPQRLLAGDHFVPYSVSPDGKRLTYFRRVPGYEIGNLSLDFSDPTHLRAGKPESFLSASQDVRVPAVSPDGKWVAYVSAESVPVQLYVRPSPGGNIPSGKWQVSMRGANGTVYWSSTANELFYQGADGRIWVVRYSTTGNSFAADPARLWSEKAPLLATNQLGLMPDGKRFVVVRHGADSERLTHLTILLHFDDELRRGERGTK